MKAVFVEEPGRLCVREVPMPAVGDYDVLCALLYGATCTGTDQHILHGRFPFPLEYPLILGHESIGRAVEVGAKVRNFSVGDLITRVGAPPAADGSYSVAWGGFAEYGIARDHQAMEADSCPRKEWESHRVNQILPEHFDPAAATMVITWRETLSYISRMGVGKGASILVLGSGGNGLSFVQHAKNLGAAHIAMLGSAAREGLGRQAGVQRYLDYHAPEPVPFLLEEQPAGFDFIIDAVGKKGQVDRVLPTLRPGGLLGIYGIDDYGSLQLNPMAARGTFTYFNGGYDESESHARVVARIEEGKLSASLFMDLETPVALSKIEDAFDRIAARKAVKVLVKLHQGEIT
jgi:D-arabinose 1-dehydrogenase-like Zn-dependent alcohol dehydrogenase